MTMMFRCWQLQLQVRAIPHRGDDLPTEVTVIGDDQALVVYNKGASRADFDFRITANDTSAVSMPVVLRGMGLR